MIFLGHDVGLAFYLGFLEPLALRDAVQITVSLGIPNLIVSLLHLLKYLYVVYKEVTDRYQK